MRIEWELNENRMRIEWESNENWMRIEWESNENRMRIEWELNENWMRIEWKWKWEYESELETYEMWYKSGEFYTIATNQSTINEERMSPDLMFSSHSKSHSNPHPNTSLIPI